MTTTKIMRHLLSGILAVCAFTIYTGCTASQAEANETAPVATVLTVYVESSDRIYVGDLQVDLDGLVSALDGESSRSHQLFLLVSYSDEVDSGTAFTVSRLIAEAEVQGINAHRSDGERTRWDFLAPVMPAS